MSRREGLDSESRRRSKFDQEPSPKRSRRDGKPEPERPPTNTNLNNQDRSDGDQKHRRRLQDALPLEAPSEHISNAVVQSIDSEKDNIEGEGKKHASDPMAVPRSRSYFQHDERDDAGQVGRGFSRKVTTDRGWWRDPKEHQSERGTRISTGDLSKKDERARGHREGTGTWRHDRYSKMEKDPNPIPRKRSFREKKDPDESEKATTVVEDSKNPNPKEYQGSESDRRGERGGHASHHAEQPNKAFDRDEGDRGERWRSYSSSRDRYTNRPGNYRVRDQFSSRGRYHPTSTGGRVDKWKHDLYDEANKSPSPKKDEDLVAKVEALLAS